jgi:hypothetical protein
MAVLTMERLTQPVATGRNGFGLFLPFLPLSRLPLIATGCDHGAPQRLHLELSTLAMNGKGPPERRLKRQLLAACASAEGDCRLTMAGAS